MSRPTPDVVVEPDAEHLARAAAAALVARLAAAQAVHGSAAVVLTGGGIGVAVLEQVAALAAEPVRETIDCSPTSEAVRASSSGVTFTPARPSLLTNAAAVSTVPPVAAAEAFIAK